MPKSPSAVRIRELMPEGYLAQLSDSTGLNTIANLSQIVRREQTTSKHWPHVEDLARRHNPQGFAQWQQEQLAATPAVTADAA